MIPFTPTPTGFEAHHKRYHLIIHTKDKWWGISRGKNLCWARVYTGSVKKAKEIVEEKMKELTNK